MCISVTDAGTAVRDVPGDDKRSYRSVSVVAEKSTVYSVYYLLSESVYYLLSESVYYLLSESVYYLLSQSVYYLLSESV